MIQSTVPTDHFKLLQAHLSREQIPNWLFFFFFGDEKLPSKIGLTISHHEDPHEPTNTVFHGMSANGF